MDPAERFRAPQWRLFRYERQSTDQRHADQPSESRLAGEFWEVFGGRGWGGFRRQRRVHYGD